MNILWDFDGTLFNTYPAYTKILTEALGRDIPEVEVFAMLKVSFGHAFRYFGLSDEQEKEMRTNVRSMEPDEFQPFPGLVEVLKKADKNVIMTHKERDDVMKVLKFHQMDAYFSDLVAGDDGIPANHILLHTNICIKSIASI